MRQSGEAVSEAEYRVEMHKSVDAAIVQLKRVNALIDQDLHVTDSLGWYGLIICADDCEKGIEDQLASIDEDRKRIEEAHGR